MIQMEAGTTKEGEDEAKTREIVDIKNDILKPLTRNIFEQFCEENKVNYIYVILKKHSSNFQQKLLLF